MNNSTKIKHVFGNPLKLAIPLTKLTRTVAEGVKTQTEEDFIPNENMPVTFSLLYTNRRYDFLAEMNANVAYVNCGTEIKKGIYDVEVTCYDNNENPLRYMGRELVEIVDATADAGISDGIEFDATLYSLNAAVFINDTGSSIPQPMNAYGVCQSEEYEQEKTVDVPMFEISKGSIVTVEFSNNVHEGDTLNIGGTGAKEMFLNGHALQNGMILAGDTAMFVYNGVYLTLCSVSGTISVREQQQQEENEE